MSDGLVVREENRGLMQGVDNPAIYAAAVRAAKEVEVGKFALEEIKEAEANKKIARVMDKKALKGKKLQLNLSDGRNFISDIKCNTNDSVVVNFKEKKLEKCLPFKDGANVMIFAGKHLGQKGVVKKIKAERKMVAVTVGKEEINALIKQIIVVE